MVVAAEVMIGLDVIASALIAQELVADIVLQDSITVQKIRSVGLGYILHKLHRGWIEHRGGNLVTWKLRVSGAGGQRRNDELLAHLNELVIDIRVVVGKKCRRGELAPQTGGDIGILAVELDQIAEIAGAHGVGRDGRHLLLLVALVTRLSGEEEKRLVAPVVELGDDHGPAELSVKLIPAEIIDRAIDGGLGERRGVGGGIPQIPKGQTA